MNLLLDFKDEKTAKKKLAEQEGDKKMFFVIFDVVVVFGFVII